jgi:hypothetical protein
MGFSRRAEQELPPLSFVACNDGSASDILDSNPAPGTLVPDVIPQPRKPLADETTIATLARQTHTSQDVVKHLFYEELAALHASASVKNFIGVIAGRRVKQRLLRQNKAQAH